MTNEAEEQSELALSPHPIPPLSPGAMWLPGSLHSNNNIAKCQKSQTVWDINGSIKLLPGVSVRHKESPSRESICAGAFGEGEGGG